MNRLSFLLLLALPFFAHAQVTFGPMVGMSSTQIDPLDLIVIDESGTNTLVFQLENANYGIHGGLFLRAQIDKFFLQPAVLFNSNSMDYRVINLDAGNAFNKIMRESYQYVDIPFIMGFKFGPVRLQGGPVGHIFVSSQTEFTDMVPEYQQRFDNVTYGWQAGLGFDIWKFMLDFNYEGNFTKLGDHFTVFGQDLEFDQAPARIVGSLAFAF